MIPVLVLTHGDLATSILESARMIDPHLVEDTDAVTLPWEVDTDAAASDLRKRLRAMDGGDGVLILTDMFGGTPSNLSYSFLEEGHIEVLSGVNLPVLIKAINSRPDMELTKLTECLETYGKKSISMASSILKGKSRK